MTQRKDLVERHVSTGDAHAPWRRFAVSPWRRALRPAWGIEPMPLGALPGMTAPANSCTEPSAAQSPELRRPGDAARRPLRVLVVEDEALISMDIEMMLEDLGAEVVGVAMTAAEAVRLAELHRPDCATMDINIKGDRDGVSAAIEIYERLGIRSIFVSAYGNEETRARAASANPFGWIKKPFEKQDLRTALDRVSEAD